MGTDEDKVKVYLFGQDKGPNYGNETLFVAPDGFYVDESGGSTRTELFDRYAKPEFKTEANRRRLMAEDGIIEVRAPGEQKPGIRRDFGALVTSPEERAAADAALAELRAVFKDVADHRGAFGQAVQALKGFIPGLKR